MRAGANGIPMFRAGKTVQTQSPGPSSSKTRRTREDRILGKNMRVNVVNSLDVRNGMGSRSNYLKKIK